MRFHFQPSGNGEREWNDDVAKEYINQSQNRFPSTEFVVQQEFRIETNPEKKTQRAGNTSPKFSEVYARNENRNEVFGVGLNYFTYHELRLGKDFPHFQPVAESAFGLLPGYIEFWKPEKIKHISLLYLDLVEIPLTAFDLDDYFHLGIKFPDKFGSVTDFESRFSFPGERKHTQLDIIFQKIPVRTGESVTRFHIHWNCQRSEINTLDSDKIREEMDALHEYVRECFEAGFTEKCKKLFQPVAEKEQA